MTEAANPWDALVEPVTRTPRSLETREMTDRSELWVEPSVIPEITPRDGWTHKWVRTGMDGSADKRTYNSRLREGWEPVDVADYPELVSFADGKTHGRVEIGGLIACRMPEEMAKQRNDHYVGLARQKEADAEEHYMRDQHELVRKINNSTRKVMFGPTAR